MMRQTLISFLFIFCYIPLFSQSTDDWQQTVNYEIDVTLNDKKHELDGRMEIEYINNSPDTLDFIYFHLWPNAYKDQSTAFAKQFLENGNADFYFSIEKDRGYIDQLRFKVGDEKLKWEPDREHKDIAKLILPEPVLPNSKVLINTPFHVKLPVTYSRMGHQGQAYQITQWYPKPAVYDQDGWHPMPYLDQGEFYSEFGRYDVEITLPQNYVVGATGDLQNEEELQWLTEKAKETAEKKSYSLWDNSFPPSDTTYKTLQYIQDNVHDFAWFADKRYHVLKGEVMLPRSGEKVTTWAMFTNEEADLWKHSIGYINEAVLFYSKHLGDYPYRQVTGLQGGLGAGSGMEYPMVTVIGYAGNDTYLEDVLLHEVGHNWFQGILASNERDNPWMDEGMNSYYESRYLEEKYPKLGSYDSLPNVTAENVVDNLGFSDFYATPYNYYWYLLYARQAKDQPVTLDSETLTDDNYGAMIYGKAALAMRYLEGYLGKATFDQIMQQYYETYKFKHVSPSDFRTLLEHETGKDLSWFFDELLNTNKTIDYKANYIYRYGKNDAGQKVHRVEVKNKKDAIAAPFSLTAFKGDSVIATRWYEGFAGTRKVEFPALKYDKLRIDAGGYVPEINRRNNNYNLKGGKRGRPIQLKLFGSLEDEHHKQIFYTPMLGFNKYDGLMLGAAFYNSLAPRKRVEYFAVPMFSLNAADLVGTANIQYHLLPKKGVVNRLTFGLDVHRFTEGNLSAFPKETAPPEIQQIDEDVQYLRFVPSATLTFRPKDARSSVEKQLQFRHINMNRESFSQDTAFYNVERLLRNNSYSINELSLSLNDKRRIHPYGFNVQLQQSKDFSLASAEVKYLLSYKGGKHDGLDVRLFGGYFLKNDAIGIALTMSDTGPRDFVYDDLLLGRNEVSGFFSQQVTMQHGGFKIPLGSVGFANEYLLAANLKTTLLSKIPVKAYFNFGYGKSSSSLIPWSEKLLVEGGLALIVVPNRFEVYLPLVYSDDFQKRIDISGLKLLQRVSFLLDIDGLNPVKLLRGAF
ncbi:MAG: M1 family metallopeptidase [Chitinophagales bacterium]